MMSLSRFITVLIVMVLLIGNFYASLSGYKEGLKQSRLLLDSDLKMHSEKLQQQLEYFNPPWPSQFTEDILYQVVEGEKIIYTSANAPQTEILSDHAGLDFIPFEGHRWRILVTNFDDRQIIIGQRYDTYIDILDHILLSAVMPLVWILPILALLVWGIVKFGLAPLQAMANQLKNRGDSDFDSISISHKTKELDVVSSSLNNLLTSLEQAFLREQRFASHAAHELRSPLTAMKLSLHNLQHNEGDYERESLDNLQANIEKMHSIIEQLLMLSKLSENKLNESFQACDLDSLIRDIVVELYERIENKHQTINFNEGAGELMTQPFVLKTAIQNIVENAHKYTPAGGQIDITIERTNTFIMINVEDSGAGLSAEEKAHIFERFYRAGGDKHRSKIEGAGLGLSIVWQCVRLLGGDIKLADSNRLGGLTVNIQIPMREAEV